MDPLTSDEQPSLSEEPQLPVFETASSVIDSDEELDIVNCIPEASPSCERRRYKPKTRYTGEVPHANTVSSMSDHERRKLQEQASLKEGRIKLQRVGAMSMFF
jgi:hypothetical protein